MKRSYFISLICIIFALAGCSNSNESNGERHDDSSGSEKYRGVELTQSKKPPSLTITFDEKIIKTRLGGYNWTYIDSKTKEMVSIEAETISLTELVEIEDAVIVNLSKPITLNFEKDPLNYEIRVYDTSGENIATYNNFKEVKEKEKAIYEVVANWEEGTGSYAIALDFE
ncbi:TPA: hypothetical protein NJY08_005159 [Salmonella enterica subsp. enterica serovar Typhi str. AG3]|nr:hypothetical protein [Salmonella enterica subsp. enterica serovar Typhi str. AG3]